MFARHVSYSSSRNSWLLPAAMFLLGAVGGVVVIRLHAAGGDSTARSRPTEQPLARSVIETGGRQAADSAAEFRKEVDAARAELRELRSADRQSTVTAMPAPVRSAPSESKPSAQLAAPSAGQLTLNYWNALNSIMAQESAMRSAPPQLTAESAGSFVSGRGQAFAYAASAIRKQNTGGVDPEAVALASDLAQWYDEGIANSRLAESLMQSTDVAARQGASGQSWQAAERHHRDRCLELNTRGGQLRQTLSRKYNLAFPALL